MNLDTNKKPADSVKRPYSKPQVARFPLRPEEAVLGNCKSSTSSGSASSACTNLACNSIGS